jgi:hypothetical protein
MTSPTSKRTLVEYVALGINDVDRHLLVVRTGLSVPGSIESRNRSCTVGPFRDPEAIEAAITDATPEQRARYAALCVG